MKENDTITQVHEVEKEVCDACHTDFGIDEKDPLRFKSAESRIYVGSDTYHFHDKCLAKIIHGAIAKKKK